MPSPTNLVYTPRSDKEVLEELKIQGLPIELKEQLHIVDSFPETIRNKIESIIKRLVETNNISGTISHVNIQLSGNDVDNAAMISLAKNPVLIISKGLLNNVQSEDELAGVIAHELGHLLLHKTYKDADHGNKVEEIAADNLGVDMLVKAGYDPNGCIYFLQRVGGSESHLITIEDITNSNSINKTANLLRKLDDPHPSEEARIRTMQIYITTIMRSGDLVNTPSITLLERPFKESVNEITYTTPIAAALKKVNYDAMSVVDRLALLTSLLDDVYPPTNRTSAERLVEIANYIERLSIDFKKADQAEAFNCLADILMGEKKYVAPPVFPKSSPVGARVEYYIWNALNKVWQKGKKDPRYLARNEDLKKAIECFTNAKTKEEAEVHACEIVTLCKKIHYLYRSTNFKGFYPPSFEEIKESIQATGEWHPPYSKHVQWYREGFSENIKNVLYMMQLADDPWVEKMLGPQNAPSENMEEVFDMRQLLTDNLWTVNVRYPQIAHQDYLSIAKPNSRKLDRFERIELFSQLERNDAGVATAITEGIKKTPPYQWQHASPNATLSILTKHQLKQGAMKRLYEENIVNTIDWQCLKTEFSRFIYQYGQLLPQYLAIVPVPSPFAKRFFAELNKLLLDAPDDFKCQVRDFFRSYLDTETPCHPSTKYWFYELDLENNHWPYLHVTHPAHLSLDDPFIQFLLSPQSQIVINDDEKLFYLAPTPGFLKPDTKKKLADIFSIPLISVLANPPKDLKTIADLHAAYKTKAYPDILIALEAERLAYQFADTITMEEFVILHHVIQSKSSNRSTACKKFYVSNVEAFFNELEHKTVQRNLNTDNGIELIKRYRYAIAHYLLEGAPAIRHAAHNKVKELLPKLPEERQLECLNALFKPDVITTGDELWPHAQDKKYDGYIAAPEFRHWAIEQLTDLLASKLGRDNGEPGYIERVKPVIDDISRNTVGITQLDILSRIATKINAQKDVAYLIRDTYKNYAANNALSKRYEGVAIELIIAEASKHRELRQKILDYLAQPLTEESPKCLSTYIHEKYSEELKLASPKTSEQIIDEQLRIYHKNFRASSLEMRTLYLEPLLFPLNSTNDEQLTIIKQLITDLFPRTSRWGIFSGYDNNDYAQLMVNAYLNAVGIVERRLLATAIFVASMGEQDAIERTIGQKLNLILSNMGPAGGKLLQAIHSHPQTPEDIKKDLASAKTMFDPPLRWELIEAVDQSGLLVASDQNPHPIQNISELVGSGSFGLTVFNTLTNQTQVADTFLRQNAAKRAEREFVMMGEATTELVQTHSEMGPIISMVTEAQRSAREETNMELAANANLKAERSYHNVRVVVGDNEFTHQVTILQKTGDNYKRVSIADGKHFNDLENSPYKQALAKAMVATQLSLRLAGFNTDLDRHGGNIKVHDNTITHFDFGAMNVTPITDEDKIAIGTVLAEAMIAVTKGIDFTKALLTSIQDARVSTASRVYLNGTNKDFLALGDYLHVIDADELASLIAQCLTDNTVDPQISAAIKAGLGSIYENAVINKLKWEARKACVHVVLNGDAMSDLAQIKEELKINSYIPMAEFTIRSSHLKKVELNCLSYDEIAKKNTDAPPIITAILGLKKYGERLKKEGNDSSHQVMNLANHLHSEVCDYVEGKTNKKHATLKINALMQQGKLIMRENRRVLDILAHIFIALTVIGLAVMVNQKMLTGTFFLTKTRRECLLSNVQEEIEKYQDFIPS